MLLIDEKMCYSVTFVLLLGALSGLISNMVTVGNSIYKFYINIYTYVRIYIYMRFSIGVFEPSVTRFCYPCYLANKPVYNPQTDVI